MGITTKLFFIFCCLTTALNTNGYAGDDQDPGNRSPLIPDAPTTPQSETATPPRSPSKPGICTYLLSERNSSTNIEAIRPRRTTNEIVTTRISAVDARPSRRSTLMDIQEIDLRGSRPEMSIPAEQDAFVARQATRYERLEVFKVAFEHYRKLEESVRRKNQEVLTATLNSETDGPALEQLRTQLQRFQAAKKESIIELHSTLALLLRSYEVRFDLLRTPRFGMVFKIYMNLVPVLFRTYIDTILENYTTLSIRDSLSPDTVDFSAEKGVTVLIPSTALKDVTSFDPQFGALILGGDILTNLHEIMPE